MTFNHGVEGSSPSELTKNPQKINMMQDRAGDSRSCLPLGVTLGVTENMISVTPRDSRSASSGGPVQDDPAADADVNFGGRLRPVNQDRRRAGAGDDATVNGMAERQSSSVSKTESDRAYFGFVIMVRPTIRPVAA